MIRFRILYDQLTDPEMDKFMCKLWRISGRHQIANFLCTVSQRFPHFPANQQLSDILPTACNIINGIIAEREPMQSSNNENTELTAQRISHLPASLVGEIASNLNQLDYIAFSKTNRKIFVDCNAPNRLQSMNVWPEQYHYSRLRLVNFPQIRRFDFELDRITEFHKTNDQIFHGNNRLRTMAIRCGWALDTDIDCLISDQSRCFSSIQCLILDDEDGSGVMESTHLLKILSKFQGLKSLSVRNLEICGQTNVELLRSLCPMISDLKFMYVPWIRPILQSWNGKVTTLSVTAWDDTDDDFGDIPHCELTSVKRLYFNASRLSENLSFLNMAQNATEIAFIPPREAMSFELIQQIRHLVKGCIMRPKIEYLYVDPGCFFPSICDAIKLGLNKTKEVERKWMEIVLNVGSRSNETYFTRSLMDIVKAFVGSKVKEWMFIVKLEANYMGSNGKTLLRTLQESADFPTSAALLSSSTAGIVIATKDCTMKRHEIWWDIE